MLVQEFFEPIGIGLVFGEFAGIALRIGQQHDAPRAGHHSVTGHEFRPPAKPIRITHRFDAAWNRRQQPPCDKLGARENRDADGHGSQETSYHDPLASSVSASALNSGSDAINIPMARRTRSRPSI